MNSDCEKYGHVALRVTLGLLFLVPGLQKLMNPGMISGMLGGLGFPAPAFFAWLLLLAEIVCGAALIVGYQVKWAALPPIVVLLVAILLVHLPDPSPMKWIDVLFRLVGISGLAYLSGAGAGEWAVGK